jgi:transcriptional antiterminator NusG
MDWYALQVYSGSELSVKKAIENLKKEEHLEDKIGQVVVPTEEVLEVKNGQKKYMKEVFIRGMYFLKQILIQLYGIKFNLFQKLVDS